MFAYKVDGEIFKFTQEQVDKRAKEKNLSTEEYLAQNPEIKIIEGKKDEDVATQGAPVASETTAPESTELGSEDFSLGLKRKINKIEKYDGTSFVKGNYNIGQRMQQLRLENDFKASLETKQPNQDLVNAVTALGSSYSGDIVSTGENFIELYEDKGLSSALNFFNQLDKSKKDDVFEYLKEERFDFFDTKIADFTEDGELVVRQVLPEVEVGFGTEIVGPPEFNFTPTTSEIIQARISMVDEDSQSTIRAWGSEYFKLDDFKAWQEDNYGSMQSRTQNRFTRIQIERDDKEEYIKQQGGDAAWELYQAFDPKNEGDYTGSINLKDLLASEKIDKETVISAVRNARFEKAQIEISKEVGNNNPAGQIDLIRQFQVAGQNIGEAIYRKAFDELFGPAEISLAGRFLGADVIDKNSAEDFIKVYNFAKAQERVSKGGKHTFETAPGYLMRIISDTKSSGLNRIVNELEASNKTLEQDLKIIENNTNTVVKIQENLLNQIDDLGNIDNPTNAQVIQRNNLIGQYQANSAFLELNATSNIAETFNRLNANNSLEIDILNTQFERGELSEDAFSMALAKNYNNWDRGFANLENSLIGGYEASFARLKTLFGADEDKTLNRLIDQQESYEQAFADKILYSLENFSASFGMGIADNASTYLNGILMFTPLKPLAYANYFAQGAGGSITEQARAEKNATSLIPKLEAKISEETNEQELWRLNRQLEQQNNVLNTKAYQRNGAALVSGFADMAMERFFGQGLIARNFAKWSKVGANATFLQKAMGTGKAYGISFLTELPEETSVQLINNFTNRTLLNRDISLFDGLDGQFVGDVFLGAGGMSTIGTAKNSYNGVKNIFITRKEKQSFQIKLQSIAKIDKQLQSPNISEEKKEELLAFKVEKIKEMFHDSSRVIQKAESLTSDQIEEIGELDRKRHKAKQEILNQAYSGEYGENMSSTDKSILQDAMDQYNQLNEQIEAIADTETKKHEEAADKAVKNPEKKNTKSEAELVYEQGIASFHNSAAKALAEQKGSGYTEVSEEQLTDEFFAQVQEDNNLSDEDVNKLKQKIRAGDNAAFVDDGKKGNIYVFTTNQQLNILLGTGLEGKIAAVAGLHEVLHKENRDQGIIKDGEVVEAARIGIASLDSLIKIKFEKGKISKEAYETYLERKKAYDADAQDDSVDYEELLNLVGDLVTVGAIKRNDFNMLFGIKNFLNKTLAMTPLGKRLNTFIDFSDNNNVFSYISSFNKAAYENRILRGGVTREEETKDIKSSIEISPQAQQYLDFEIDNESLVDIVNSRSSKAEERFGGVEALIEKNWPIISNAVKFNPTGEISMEAVKQAVSEQMLGIFPEVTLQDGKKIRRGDKRLLDTYDRTKKVTTFLSATLGPRTAEILARGKQIDAATRGVSLDKATGIQDDSAQPFAEESGTYQKAKPKINILQDFTGVPENEIVSLAKPAEGDTFKQIIKKYAGRAGQLVFGIPAKKIMEGGANLVPTTKIKEGMAVPSEALQIQRFFGAAQNLGNFVKTLPLYNVTEMTADINRQGENIEVSRDTYGIAIGLKGLPLDYFYEDFTDPTGVMTSPKGRSKGLTSQTPVKKLKQKFRKPTKEVLDQLRKDLGITPAGQKNEYTRDIGQLLKGVAKVYSINTALSGAQRNQEAKLKTAKPEDVKAIKQQTADITAAQSKISYSKGSKAFNTIENPSSVQIPLVSIQLLKDLLEGKTRTGFRDMDAEFEPGVTFDQKATEIANKFLNQSPEVKSLVENTMTGGVRGGLFLTKPEFNKRIKTKEAKDVSEKLNSYRYNYNSEKRLTKKAVENFNDKDIAADRNARLDILHNFWKDVETYLKDNPQDQWFFEALVRDTSRGQQALTRVLAPFRGYAVGENGKPIYNLEVVEEHSMPQNNISYAYLNAAIKGEVDELKPVIEASYMQISLLKTDDDAIREAGLEASMPDIYFDVVVPKIKNGELELAPGMAAAVRLAAVGTPYAPKTTDNVIDLNKIYMPELDQTIAQHFGIDKIKDIRSANVLLIEELAGVDFKNTKLPEAQLSKAISKARTSKIYSSKSVGMSTFDFDETLIIDGENFIVATKGDDVQRISSGDWPLLGPALANEGYTFDFTDFVNVRGGVDGPLLQKMKNQIKKYGPKNVFILTARPAEAATAIHEWLKTKGINIPFENITGLGNSTGDAKAAWFLDKYAEGYNDMYFVDDALPNVEAVKHVFDQLDIKGKSVQAKIKFSKGLTVDFNKMLERTKGVGAEKIFSRIGAQKRGKNIGKFAFFVPPSADDFAGLLRYFADKGEQGNKDIAFFKKALLDPFARADRDMKEARQAILDDYKALRKTLPQVSKKLGKMIDKSGFTFDNAIRVYLWDKAGFEIPGLSKRDVTFLSNVVETDQDLKSYAKTIGLISKQTDGYIKPTEYWDVESIASDLQNIVNKEGRKQYLAEWIENKDEIFTPENLNKIEAVYGSNFREALENILWRMENGTNRAKGMGRIEAKWNNWVNNSVGAIMFFNARSAVLQTLSTVNFINFEDNNIFAAAKAFANQKQYWKDFSFLFNSDFLRQRRAGLQSDINEAELASAVAGAANKAKAALQYLLKIGFTPTQIADSFAIASGGATYYRNRVNKYVKEGMDQKAAEEQAMLDFQEIAEETQQSARPDRISQQQASSLGRIILAFANTPMQYARLIKKASVDLIKGRGDWRSNVSRIIYYGAVQNFIFTALQNALFALAFSGEEPEEDEVDEKTTRIVHGMLDSLLRGSGLAGAVVSTIKNSIREFERQKDKKGRADYAYVLVEALNVSPPIGSKARKLYSGALKTYEYNGDVMGEFDTFDLENPLWTIVGNVVSATTNLPLDRAFRKIDNIKEALNQDNQTWQRIGLALGWDQWSLGVDPYKDIKEAEKRLRVKKREEKKKNQQRCTKIKSDGTRCKMMVNKPKKRCHYHD